MATGDRFQWNMAGLIDLSNDVLEADCIPLAEKVADAARDNAPEATGDYKKSIHVESRKRTSEDDWARAQVVADDDKAAIIESRRGVLGRALGSIR